MYNEDQNYFLRNLVIKALLVVLFVFLLIWLFPMPKLDTFYDRIFADNIKDMRDAGHNYFTLERLPKNENDKIRLTLEEMIELKMILPFVDKNNKSCDLTNSYVEVTKVGIEYIFKTNLSCDSKTDYIIDYLGCYDVCLITKTETSCDDIKPVVKPVVKPEKPEKPVQPVQPEKPEKPEKPVQPKVYEYQYKKTEETNQTVWLDWSSWSTTAVTANALRQVETKNVSKTETVQETVLHSTKNEIIQEVRSVVIGEQAILSCNKWASSSTVSTYEAWYFVGEQLLNYAPKDTESKFYVRISVANDAYLCDSDKCVIKQAVYKVYEKRTTTVTTSTGAQVCTGYNLTKKDVYGDKMITYVKTTPIYVTIPKEIVTTEIQYRFKNAEIKTTVSTKYVWSTSKSDSNLLKQGYVLTNNSREKR